eukprot:2495490-Prorocentrum_lima.AAC.1
MTLMLRWISSIRACRLPVTARNKSSMCCLNATSAHNNLSHNLRSGSWQNTCTHPSAGGRVE